MQHGSPLGVVRRSLLSTAEAAAAAACHRTTVIRAIERGELEAVRLGEHGSYRIDPGALEAWLQPAGPDGGLAA